MQMRTAALSKILFVVSLCTLACFGRSDHLESELFYVPASEIASSVTFAIDLIRQVTSTLSEFAGAFGDFRLSNAVSDCQDLMDFSLDQLSWTLFASENPNSRGLLIVVPGNILDQALKSAEFELLSSEIPPRDHHS